MVSETEEATSVVLGDGSVYMDFAPDPGDPLPQDQELEELEILGYELRGEQTLDGGWIAEVVNWTGSGLLGAAATLGLGAATSLFGRRRAKDLVSADEAWDRVRAAIDRARGLEPEPSLRRALKNTTTGEWSVTFVVDGEEGRALVLGNGAVVALDFAPPSGT